MVSRRYLAVSAVCLMQISQANSRRGIDGRSSLTSYISISELIVVTRYSGILIVKINYYESGMRYPLSTTGSWDH